MQDDAFWDDYDNNYNANRAITITNNKLKYSLHAKKYFKKLWFSRSLFIPFLYKTKMISLAQGN